VSPTQPATTKGTFMKILLAIDGSETSNAAVEEVAKLPWPAESSVRLLSVLEIPFTPTPETWSLPNSYYSQLEQAAQEQADAAVKAAQEMLSQGTTSALSVSAETRTGVAKNEILKEAETWGADLIVLGSHGYKGWERFMLGSVSQAVAGHAHCSVLIVRHPEIKASRQNA